jgi:uncharacterized membrane protein
MMGFFGTIGILAWGILLIFLGGFLVKFASKWQKNIVLILRRTMNKQNT